MFLFNPSNYFLSNRNSLFSKNIISAIIKILKVAIERSNYCLSNLNIF